MVDRLQRLTGCATPPPGTHEWISFPDGRDRTWVIDVTFLLSRWDCIFGQGCLGVLTGPAPELAQGCCSYGAHFTGVDDLARVEKAAQTLTPAQWQFASKARTKSGKLRIAKTSADGELVGRLAEGACIFLNRVGFAAGPGCALHAAALQRGERPMDLKPDVCWQVPLRREDETDATGHTTSTLRQWDRRHWGEGGSDFHWWCTTEPGAFGGRRPVYQSLRDEITAMIGSEIYALVATELDRRRAQGTSLTHPADRAPVANPRRR